MPLHSSKEVKEALEQPNPKKTLIPVQTGGQLVKEIQKQFADNTPRIERRLKK